MADAGQYLITIRKAARWRSSAIVKDIINALILAQFLLIIFN